MAEVTPIPAASIILLRDEPLELLMIRRHEKSSFAPDVWAFPGGALEFDTYFLLARVGRNTVITLQKSEAVDWTWISPADAVQRHMAGSLPLVFPTLKNLEAIAGFRSASELIESRRKAEIHTTRPILVVENGLKRIVLP